MRAGNSKLKECKMHLRLWYHRRRSKKKAKTKETKKNKYKCTEEMVQLRCINQETLDNLEVQSRVVHKVRGEPLEWRVVQRGWEYQLRKWCKECWARIYSWFGECGF